ncbi:MAG: hypothetical protein WAK22_18285 [Candidatus Sulfotelmatobacter sp.]
MTDFSWTTFLGSIVGGGATAWLVVKGLSGHLGERWLARYKSDLDKEFEKYRGALEQQRKRVEADLGQRTYVSKAQFDIEFSSIKDIFATLGKLRLSFNGLRPFVDWIPPDDEGKLQLISVRLSHFKPRLDAFITAVESAYPFVPDGIYEQLEICMRMALIELHHIEEGGAKALSASGYSDGLKQHEQFTKAYFAAARLVRERLKHLSEI